MKNDVVMIKLDKPRFLRYGHKALKKLTAITGKTFDEINLDNFDLETLEIVLYCGLLSDAKENNETIKLEDMEDLLDQADSYSDIISAMGKAFEAAFGTNGTNEKN